VTLFTGQWADLTLEEVARHAAEWGYDGLKVWTISNRLTGQAVCDDPIDFRHRNLCQTRPRRPVEAQRPG